MATDVSMCGCDREGQTIFRNVSQKADLHSHSLCYDLCIFDAILDDRFVTSNDKRLKTQLLKSSRLSKSSLFHQMN